MTEWWVFFKVSCSIRSRPLDGVVIPVSVVRDAEMTHVLVLVGGSIVGASMRRLCLVWTFIAFHLEMYLHMQQ